MASSSGSGAAPPPPVLAFRACQGSPAASPTLPLAPLDEAEVFRRLGLLLEADLAALQSGWLGRAATRAGFDDSEVKQTLALRNRVVARAYVARTTPARRRLTRTPGADPYPICRTSPLAAPHRTTHG